MRTHLGCKIAADGFVFCQRFLSLSLALVMLCDAGLWAATPVSSQHIEQHVRQEVAKAVPTQSPQQFLQKLRLDMEQLVTSASVKEPEDLDGYSLQEYSTRYQKEVEKFYSKQVEQVEQEAKTALDSFDKSADEQRVLYLSPQRQEVEAHLQQEREKYAAQINEWKENTLAELNQEKVTQLSQTRSSYAQYKQEVAAYKKKVEQEQEAFYRDLVKQIIANYQLTRDVPSKANFVSLMMYLSSFANQDKIITGEDRVFIKKALYNNFTIAQHACAGVVKTEFEEDGTWGSAALGGSPSAGRMYDTTTNRKQVFKLNDEEKCNLAISSLIPYANLDGDGYAITNFLQSNFDNPMFGQILLVGSKALLLTKHRGMEAFSAFVDKAIAKENSARKKNFWAKLDLATVEGITRALSAFTGKYFAHNVSSSAQRDPGEPNVWEDVAELLAKENTPAADAILDKAIAQCSIELDGEYPSAEEYVSCKGIYPFLLGVLTQKPALAAHLRHAPRPGTTVGQEMDAYGNTRIITEEEAAAKRAYYNSIALTKKYTKGEILGHFLYDQFFEDIYPADKQRMDNLIAKNRTLNPKGRLVTYTKQEERYRKLVNKFNRNVVVVAIGSVVDYMIAFILIKDLGRIVLKAGVFAKNATNVIKVRYAIIAYQRMPAGLSATVQMKHVFQARKIGMAELRSHRVFVGKVDGVRAKLQKIPQFNTKAVAQFREAYAPVVSVNPEGIKFTGPALTYQESYVVNNWKDLGSLLGQKTKQGFQLATSGVKKAWTWATPWSKAASKEAITLDSDHLTLTMQNRKKQLVKVSDLKIEDGILHINGQMAKTYKAYLPLNQLEPLAALAKENKLSLGFDNMWVKLVDNTEQSSKWQKVRALNKDVQTVPLYNAAGVELLHVGFNPGFTAQANLLTRINNGGRLVFADGKIHLAEGGVLKTLRGVEQISIPKTTVSNAVRAQNIGFLNGLFALPDKGAGALRIIETKNKLLWPMGINFLSYSAASSALMMTLERPPFNLSSTNSILVGLALPYASAFFTPVFAPFVRRFGARNVMVASLLLASGSLGVAMGNGYYGKKITRDENGQLNAPLWPLYLTAAMTGIASTGIRASSNIVIKGYQLKQATMTRSMVLKSLGAMVMTAIPAAALLISGKEKDFSIAYPFLAGFSLVTAGGLLYTMPKLAERGYKLTRSAFSSPWKFLFKNEVWPYVAGIGLMSSLEGYVYFKGISALDRDILGSKENGFGWHETYAKFGASVATAIPQLALRLFSPRKNFFGRGLFNSALLAGAGTAALMLPTENWGLAGNIGIGALSGSLIGLGTAQVYQYNQKLFNAAVKAKFGEAMVPTGQVLYSMGNLGLALPAVFGFKAQKRKDEYGENDFFSTQRTFQLPLISYVAGIGLIALAEHSLVSKATSLLGKGAKTAGKLAVPVVGGASLLTPQAGSLAAPSLLNPDNKQGFKLNLQEERPSLQTDEVPQTPANE